MSRLMTLRSRRDSGMSPLTIRCARPFDDRGLADAGLADQDGVVLGAAGEDLDHAADLVVAADDRVELAVLGVLREVAAELLQRLVLVLGALVGDPVRAADGLDRLERVLWLAPARLRILATSPAWAEVIASRMCSVEMYSSLSLPASRSARRRMSISSRLVRRLLGSRGDRRELLEQVRRLGPDRSGAGAELAQDGPDDALGLVEQRDEQVLGLGLGVLEVGRDGDRGLQRLLGLDREAVGLHVFLNLSRSD